MSRVISSIAPLRPALFISILLGRIPIWALLILYINGNIDNKALICLYLALILARAYLQYGNGSSGAALVFSTLWRNFFRLFAYPVFAWIAASAIVYGLLSKDPADLAMLLLALLFYVPVVIINILTPKTSEEALISLTDKPLTVRLGVAALWLYITLSADPAAFRLGALTLVYIMEFYMIYRPKAAKGAA